MHQVSKPRAANQSMTEESGLPGTRRSKVGCDAIDEPWTKRIVPLAGPADAGFCHKNSFTSPLRVQCSLPFILGLNFSTFGERIGNSIPSAASHRRLEDTREQHEKGPVAK